jgi:hypothetical protein
MHLSCLPEELILHVLTQLSVWRLCVLAAVGPAWRVHIKACEFVWTSFFYQKGVRPQSPLDVGGCSISFPCPNASNTTNHHIEVARLVQVLVQPLPNEQSWQQWLTHMRRVNGALRQQDALGTTTTLEAKVLQVYKSGYYQILILRREFLEHWHLFTQVWNLCRRADFPITDPLLQRLRLKVSRSACILTEVLCLSKRDLRQCMIENLHKLCPVLLTTSRLFKLISDLLELGVYPEISMVNAELQSIRRLARRMKYFYRNGSKVLQVLRRGA